MSGIIEATSQLRPNNSHCIKQHAGYIIIRTWTTTVHSQVNSNVYIIAVTLLWVTYTLTITNYYTE